jgi:hypothetical protein
MAKADAPAVLKCPFCGQRSELCWQYYTEVGPEQHRWRAWVACSYCGAVGPAYGAREKKHCIQAAVSSWNRAARLDEDPAEDGSETPGGRRASRLLSWIHEDELMDCLKDLAARHGRTIQMEALYALQLYADYCSIAYDERAEDDRLEREWSDYYL